MTYRAQASGKRLALLPACHESKRASTGGGEDAHTAALVVDDSLGVAEELTTLLRRTGWTVDVATSVDAALEHVRGVPYDLVVCDVCMPDGGGPAVYYAATTRRPDLTNRFLFITGNVDDPEPWRFLAKIRAHVLEKPFTGRALRHALIKVIA